jgi:hypothetical protein
LRPGILLVNAHRVDVSGLQTIADLFVTFPPFPKDEPVLWDG